MKTKEFALAIIGGGASGLTLACALSQKGVSVAVFERGERVGKKLSATGNGQGNITHTNAGQERYFSSTKEGALQAQRAIQVYDETHLTAFYQELGVLLAADARGRVPWT